MMMQAQAQVALRSGDDAAAEALRDLFREVLRDEQPLRRIGAIVAGSDVRHPMPGGAQNPLTGATVPDFTLDADHGTLSGALHTSPARDCADVSHSSDMETKRGLNVIETDGKQFLLTATAGDSIHLTREAHGEEGDKRPAIPSHYLEDFVRTYDMAAILEPKWAERTLCGRQWILMEADGDDEEGEAGYAPSCRRCLTLLDKLFPAPKLDDRFPLIVQVIADTVAEHGTAEIFGVPGDHQAALRREVRAEVKKRTGHGLKTYAHESMVIFVCDPIYDLHADERMRRGAEAVGALLSSEPVSRQSPTRLWWETWAAE
jgi:hypothetical protein